MSGKRRRQAGEADDDRVVGAKRDDDAVRDFVEQFASVLVDAGMPRMPARAFAALLATDSGRLTAAEMGELLHISPAAVSGAGRYLMQTTLASKERQPGSRRDVYRVHDDVWYEAALSREPMMRRWAVTVGEGIDAVGPDTPAGHRLTETKAFLDFYREEMVGIRERWRHLRDQLRDNRLD